MIFTLHADVITCLRYYTRYLERCCYMIRYEMRYIVYDGFFHALFRHTPDASWQHKRAAADTITYYAFRHYDTATLQLHAIIDYDIIKTLRYHYYHATYMLSHGCAPYATPCQAAITKIQRDALYAIVYATPYAYAMLPDTIDTPHYYALLPPGLHYFHITTISYIA